MGTACSGIGGAEVAVRIAGLPVRSRWAIEIGAHQSEVLRRRFGVRVHPDAYECGRGSLEPVDIFAAGFPCQPFSIAGRRGGAKDPRNLWPEIARITEELGPLVVLFENVPALRNPHPAGVINEDDEDEGEESADALPSYLGTVLGDLVDLGYHVAWDGRSASSMGAPHRRDRCWIVGWRAASVSDFDPFWPTERALDARQIGEWTGERWERSSLFGGEVVMKWPRSGIVRGRQAFEVGTSGVADARSLAWPTPLADSNPTDSRANSAQGGVKLVQAAHIALSGPTWPTTTTEDAEQSGHRGETFDTLTSAARGALAPQWQTPQTHDEVKPDADRDGRYGTEHGGRNLNDQAANAMQDPLWNTPVMSDHQSKHKPYAQGGWPLQMMAEEALRPDWQSPTAGDATGGHKSRGGDRIGELLLGGQVQSALDPEWPTAAAADAGGPTNRRFARGNPSLEAAGREAMEIYPTPNAFDAIEDFGQRAEASGKHAMSLRHVAPELLTPSWPTTRTTDSKGSGPIGSKSQQSRLNNQQLDATVIEATRTSGLLNPRWVEALMGYPPGWTDLTVNNEDVDMLEEMAGAWGHGSYRIGDLKGTNPKYAGYWLWHPDLGELALPVAPREPQTKNRLISLGNAWVPQVAGPILERIVVAISR